MKFVIVLCLFFAAYPVLAQTTDKPSTATRSVVEAKTKLNNLNSQIENAKLELKQLKTKLLHLKKRDISPVEPPYSWQATICEHVVDTDDTINCVWHFKNNAGTYVCEDSWLYKDGKWYQNTFAQCQEKLEVYCAGVGCGSKRQRGTYGGLGGR